MKQKRCYWWYCCALLLLVFNVGQARQFQVINGNNAGLGSLRAAIDSSNTRAGFDTITFSGPLSITITAALPTLSEGVFIDGPVIAGFRIEINGSATATSGITIAASAAGTIIKGLNIRSFNGNGIVVAASNVNIHACYIGTNINGTAAQTPALGTGIDLAAGVNNIQIGGSTADSSNVISGNATGIVISAGCSNIRILNNKIGTNASGTAAVPNTIGILGSNSTNIVIGGKGSTYRNIISGNSAQGIMIVNNCSAVTISGNYIGTGVTGNTDLGNGTFGVQVNQSAVLIGGASTDSSNVLSGNNQIGIDLINANGVQIRGNTIGLGADGITVLGNTVHGIQMSGSSNCFIGGSTTNHKNVISSNGTHGIVISNSNSITVRGNYIGTDATGTLRRGNTSHGIQLQETVSSIVIGGRRFVDGNVISGNGGIGINFQDPVGNNGKANADGTIIKGNLIGTDFSGTQNLGNTLFGIILKSDNCIIGDTTNNEGNIICGSNVFGLLMANSNNTIVRGNYIGTGITGTELLGNKNHGISIAAENAGRTANKNIIQYNTIAYNVGHAVSVGAIEGAAFDGETGNNIRFNKIYCNSLLGINLNLSSPTDAGNNANVAPRIDFFKSTNNVIEGITDSELANEKIDLYLVLTCVSCDINPQGSVWIDSTVADESGNWSYDYFAKFGTTIPGKITATATDNAGNTSQFSTCCFAVAGTTLTPSINPVCPGTNFSITYSNGQQGDSLMLQLAYIPNVWTNVQRAALSDPITFHNITITDTAYFRVITYSQGTYTTAQCKDSSDAIRVDLANVPVAGNAGIDTDTICEGESFNLTLTGYTGTIQWQQSNNGGAYTNINPGNADNFFHSPLASQSPVDYRAIVSNGICPNDTSTVVRGAALAVNSGFIGGPAQVCNASTATLNLSGYLGAIQWEDSLSGGNWAVIPGQNTASLLYAPSAVVTTDYIRVLVTDPTGNCSEYSAVFPLKSDTCTAPQPIYPANALTPGGDGNNEVFYIENIWLYPNNQLTIYNRWGNVVYETNGYINTWDGTSNGEKLPVATYYYVLKLNEDINGNLNEENDYHGTVTIIR